MRIIFMGTPEFAVPSLESLLNHGFDVVGVVTQPDRPKGRGQVVVASPIKQLAQTQGLPVLQPEKMKSPELLQSLAAWRPDMIAVTAFGRILPKSILDLPTGGCVNVHGSLLPRYRGAAPIQWSLINGDLETGITTMFMDEGMDTGAMLLQRTIPIEPDDTAAELGSRLAMVGGELLVETLQGLANKTVTPQEQDHDKVTYAPLLTKEAGMIDWTQSANGLANRIRGLSPWPGCFTFLRDQRLVICQAKAETEKISAAQSGHRPGTIVDENKKEFWVLTGEGTLRVTAVQPANKKRMTVEQFLQGRSIAIGQVFTSGPASASSLS
jgi:methionyl-tRNA formyltransferase